MITPVLRNTLKNTPKKSVEGLNVGDAVVLECDSRFGLKKGDTGVVSKNSNGYVSAKMDKDGSLIGFRVEENPFKKVVTEGGDASSDVERMDAEYMEAVKSGDIGKCASMVEAAAKNNLRGTQVVDGNRNPLKVYHSSRNKNLKSFDLGFVPAGNVGFHFGPKEIADVIHRTKPGNHEPKAYYLDILNPMTFSEDCFGTSDCLFNELAVTGEILNHIRRGGQAYVELLKEFERMDAIVNDDYDSKYTDERYGYSDPKLHKLLLDTLYEAGYDGIVYANSCEGSGDICWIALDPHQVKSADPITYYDDGTVVPLSKRFDQYSEMVDESRAGDDVVARIMEFVSKYDSGDLSANGVADGIAALSRETEVPEPVIRFTKAFATSVETLGSDSEGFDETIGSEYVDDIRDWCGNPVNEKTVCEEWRPASRSVSEAAKRAMPNTKAADSEGYPMMLYHGTSAYGFREFEGNSGFWASTAREYAEEYTESGGFGKPGVYRVFMNIENPLEVGRLDDDFDDDSVKILAENMGVSFDELSDWMCDAGFDWREGSFPKWDVTTSVLFVEWLRELGFDGMHATEGTRDAETWCAFDSNQIKSAEDVTYSEDGVEIPVEDRFDMASNDINESQNTDDATYLAAAKTKNYKLCRKMVEEKAKVAFAGSRLVTKDGMPIKLYHGTAFNIHKFEGGLDTITWVTPDIDYADVYADYDRHPDADNDGVIMSLYVYARNMVDIGDINEPFSEEGVRRIAKAIGCTYDELKSSIGKYSYDFLYEINEYVASIARKKGIDILVAKEGDLDRGVKRKVVTIGVLDFINIKSADPVTKYEDGTIVPLSKRFDFGTDDIREDTEESVPPEPAAEVPPEEKKVELEKPCWKNPDDWKKDEFLVEFKNNLGYRDEYFPTKSYSDCADSVAREYTLEMPTDTEAREIEGDAVMLLIKSGLKDSIKVAHELGEIVMGNRKGGPRHKKLLKAMQKAYHELVTCSARFDNDDVNESEERDAAFARWFRSSVVKDASGKPLVVYHGSSKSGITEFNEVRSGNGIFFTSSKEVANDYAVGKENQVYPCYLRIEHPFVIDAHGSKWSDMKFKEHRAVAKYAGYRWITPLEVIGYVTEVYQNEHPECDGIIIRNVVDTNASKVCADDYIVFNPKQIKSVDNGGAFSDDTANIFESR